jgi:hypothetical protein
MPKSYFRRWPIVCLNEDPRARTQNGRGKGGIGFAGYTGTAAYEMDSSHCKISFYLIPRRLQQLYSIIHYIFFEVQLPCYPPYPRESRRGF